jgi:hypothetical protein
MWGGCAAVLGLIGRGVAATAPLALARQGGPLGFRRRHPGARGQGVFFCIRLVLLRLRLLRRAAARGRRARRQPLARGRAVGQRRRSRWRARAWLSVERGLLAAWVPTEGDRLTHGAIRGVREEGAPAPLSPLPFPRGPAAPGENNK